MTARRNLGRKSSTPHGEVLYCCNARSSDSTSSADHGNAYQRILRPLLSTSRGFLGQPDLRQLERERSTGCRCARPVSIHQVFIQEEALQFLERLIAFLNDLHARKGAIEPSYRKVRQTSAVDIYRLLPHFQQAQRQRPDSGLGPGGPAQPACWRMKNRGSGPDSPLRVGHTVCDLSKKSLLSPKWGMFFFKRPVIIRPVNSDKAGQRRRL